MSEYEVLIRDKTAKRRNAFIHLLTRQLDCLIIHREEKFSITVDGLRENTITLPASLAKASQWDGAD